MTDSGARFDKYILWITTFASGSSFISCFQEQFVVNVKRVALTFALQISPGGSICTILVLALMDL